MTEEAGFAEPSPPAPEPDSGGQPGTGPVADDTAAAEPVTDAPDAAPQEFLTTTPGTRVEVDNTGAVTFHEPDTAEPVPEPDADPQEVAEQAAAAEPAETTSASAGHPDPVPPPFIPADGVAPWLREVLTWLHDRIRVLEG